MHTLDISIAEGLIRATPKSFSDRTGGALISVRASGLPGSDSTSRPHFGQVPPQSTVTTERSLDSPYTFI